MGLPETGQPGFGSGLGAGAGRDDVGKRSKDWPW